MKKALLVAAALAVGSSVLAQDHPNFQRGLGSPASYASGQLDAINVFNGNLTLQIPLGITYPVNGNLSYGLTLRYNSQVW